MNGNAADLPTHVAVELRLTASEAAAVEHNLTMLATMIQRQVVQARGGDTDSLLSGLAKLRRCLSMRMEPFDDFGV